MSAESVQKTEEPMEKEKKGFFYGWWIVVSCFVFLFISTGFAIYGFSLFVKPIAMDMGFTRGQLMVGITTLMLLSGIFGPVVGRIVDKKGVRIILVVGAVFFSLGFLILYQLKTLWMFYMAYVVMAVGAVCIGPVPCSAVTAQWFRKKQGTATGIMSAGIGVGGLVMAPLLGGFMIPAFGWRETYLIMAVIGLAVILLLSLLVIRSKPSEIGLYPDGDQSLSAAQQAANQANLQGLTVKEALGTSRLWLIGFAFMTFAVPQLGIVQHQVPHLCDLGFTAALAGSVLGIVGMMSGVGKVLFGWLADKISVKLATIIGFSLQLVGILMFASLTKESSVVMLYAFAIIFGLGTGSWLPLLAILVTKNFGLREYGSIIGILILLQIIGSASGPIVAGFMYDAMGNYSAVFTTFVILNAMAIGGLLILKQPKQMQSN